MTDESGCPLFPDADDRQDALADLLVGEAAYGVADHVLACAVCANSLDALRAALPVVAARVTDLPIAPEPAGLQERLSAALDAARVEEQAPDAPAPTNLAPHAHAEARVTEDDLVGQRAAEGQVPANLATVLPLPQPRDRRWLPWAGGVAAAAVLVTGGVLVSTRSPGQQASMTSAASAPVPALVRNNTGTDYGKDGAALAAAVPALLTGRTAAAQDAAGAAGDPPTVAGSGPAPGPTGGSASGAAAAGGAAGGSTTAATPEPASPVVGVPAPGATGPRATSVQPEKAVVTRAAPDPLARLRTDEGLASCLSSLAGPDVPGIPLAVDYAAFAGQPALVVLLPSSRAGKVDVFVLGAGCSATDAKVLYFARLSR